MTLKHYYHVYADGLWETPFKDHLAALISSNLINNLDFVGVGIVGGEANRLRVKRFLPEEFVVVSETNSGWEQVTLSVLSKDIQTPSKILYAHTKGAANNRHDQANWRKEMTETVVNNWKPCVTFLDEFDVVGCRWIHGSYRYYSGTFWWATSKYISSLPEISFSHRDNAEIWIGKGSLGGSHVHFNVNEPNLSKVHSFGRIFAAEKTAYGSLEPFCEPDTFLSKDEFVGFTTSPIGNRIMNQLSKQGKDFFIQGDSIIVK